MVRSQYAVCIFYCPEANYIFPLIEIIIFIQWVALFTFCTTSDVEPDS